MSQAEGSPTQVGSSQITVTPLSTFTQHSTGVEIRLPPVLTASGSNPLASPFVGTPRHVGSTENKQVPSITDQVCKSVRCTITFQQPSGFKELWERVNKFAGDGMEDFEVWLVDYCEATDDCGWTDPTESSLVLTGAAKHMYLATNIEAEDKAT